ncbi:CLUMA_CG015944, isoform A [Clunio marinus]|uniref:CLUMA_CG015944, isoform A n=1 Tax=Clunio marinus TaxID=568069 RepID=A0A1J1IWM6_9DIPT|nr:CLUMA_CG015944, isoform A [Clunio marinus]
MLLKPYVATVNSRLLLDMSHAIIPMNLMTNVSDTCCPRFPLKTERFSNDKSSMKTTFKRESLHTCIYIFSLPSMPREDIFFIKKSHISDEMKRNDGKKIRHLMLKEPLNKVRFYRI